MWTLKLYGIKISAKERAGDRVFKKRHQRKSTLLHWFDWLFAWASTLGYDCHSDGWIAQFYNWFLIDIPHYFWNVGPWFLTEADKIILEPSTSWNDDCLYFLYKNQSLRTSSTCSLVAIEIVCSVHTTLIICQASETPLWIFHSFTAIVCSYWIEGLRTEDVVYCTECKVALRNWLWLWLWLWLWFWPIQIKLTWLLLAAFISSCSLQMTLTLASSWSLKIPLYPHMESIVILELTFTTFRGVNGFQVLESHI